MFMKNKKRLETIIFAVQFFFQFSSDKVTEIVIDNDASKNINSRKQDF